MQRKTSATDARRGRSSSLVILVRLGLVAFLGISVIAAFVLHAIVVSKNPNDETAESSSSSFQFLSPLPRARHNKNVSVRRQASNGLNKVAAAVTRKVMDANQQQHQHQQQHQQQQHNKEKPPPLSPQRPGEPRRLYPEWREIAVNLAKLPPAQALRVLHETDPFGVRTFAQQLLQAETAAAAATSGNHGNSSTATLSLATLRQLFPCPPERLSLPDQRDHEKAAAFRDGHGFLFFQHLRKAGGTHFCALATANFPRSHLPPYYCMPDYQWPLPPPPPPADVPHGRRHPPPPPRQACAGCLHHWTNDEIVHYMTLHHHRIAGNEWDSFDAEHHLDLPAVFVTSFRQPIDRALSQFRFECVEDRGCTIQDPGVWWQRRRDLHNVYTTTFSDTFPPPPTTNDTDDPQQQRSSASQQRGDVLGRAMDVIAKFHLVLSMEWLSYAEGPVRQVLGFRDTSALSKRVRPHNAQKQRHDSWIPREYLTPAQYQDFAHQLVLDEILTDVARRLFLERLVCESSDDH